MLTRSAIQDGWLTVNGVQLEVVHKGQGQPLLLLHSGEGLNASAPFLDGLAQRFEVIAPSHPGFGHSPLPDSIDTVDDIAYLYLDLLEELELKDVILMGFSLGGWIAAEMAVKSVERLSKVILVDPVGIKPGDRETRDIPDIYALPAEEVMKLAYHNPPEPPDFSSMSDEELTIWARNRETMLLLVWEPYMHNPKMLHRLHRIKVPALILRGASDGLVSDAYARAYQAAIPGALYRTIEQAGHAPQLEQPQAFVDEVVKFVSK